MNIVVLALDKVFDTGLAAILDVFTTANELNALHELQLPPLTVELVGVRQQVRTAQGMERAVKTFDEIGAMDWVVVPAIGHKLPETLLPALAHSDVQMAATQLQNWAGQGAKIAAACIGTFVLAESGLLAHQQATTTWWLAPLFRQRYPNVQVHAEQMVVASGHVVTAGAALSHVDLALWLLRQRSPAQAALVAKYLIVDSRPSQAAYMISDHLAHSHPLVEQFDRWARAHLAEPFNLDVAAVALATSKRTLARRMDEVLGTSPVKYVQQLRLERAVHLLKTTALGIEQIAEQVGYRDGVTLRNLLRRNLGTGIRQLRSSEFRKR